MPARLITQIRQRIARPGWPPAIVWVPAWAVGLVLLLPLAYLVIRTFGGGGQALDLLLRVRVLQILVRTLTLVFAVTGASIILALPLAWLTVRSDLPGRKIWRVATLLPLVIPSYVGGFIVVVALGPRGMLQGFLESMLGVQRLPDVNGFFGAMITLTFLSYPYVLLTVRAALWRIDPTLEESSRGLGYGAWSTYRRVTLSLLRPAIAGGGLLVALYTLSDFGVVSLLRYETFTSAIFVQYESALDRTLGAALSLVLVVLALSLVGLEAITRTRSRYYRNEPGATRPATLVRLGKWRWPALLFCASVVMISLILPMSVLVYWVVRGVSAGEPLLLLGRAAINSLFVSLLAAIITLLASIPVATLTVRYPGVFSSFLERLAYIGFALPGIAIALGLVFFGANFARFIYQTTGMLILAYVILFLPAALGAVRTSLLQVSPSIEYTARSLGRSPFGVLTSVTIPLVRPGVLAGAALVFLLTMKELPATLILSPPGFQTLAGSIWGAASEAFFAQAAAPALLLILVSSVPLALLTLKEAR